MYDMYPEWGPAKNNPDHPMSTARGAQDSAADLRDGVGQLPDDN